ncbi:hypothetical protein R1flu_012647 [Riccia fluitans]|uniref:Thioredoxin domain-containing protein n=1 Tax=Riccia fluitans TaxID=41844 RepID=A0ABD1ZB66_9MARC
MAVATVGGSMVVAAQFEVSTGAASAAGGRRATVAVQSGSSGVRASRATAGAEVVLVGGVQWNGIRKGKSTRGATAVVRAEAGGDASTATVSNPPATTPAAAEESLITEVDKDTFWPIVKSAGEKLVVLDMYTQWCGPCKLILPKIQALAATLRDEVIFCKLDCNQENKPLAKELGIRVVPTFKIFKNGELVTSITGAKYDNLVAAIESARQGK